MGSRIIAAGLSLALLSACGGEGSVTTNIPSNILPGIGSNITFNDKMIYIGEVAADGSYIIVRSDLDNFQAQTDVSLKLIRVSSDSYVYENDKIMISLSRTSDSNWVVMWDIKDNATTGDVFASLDLIDIDITGSFDPQGGAAQILDPNFGRTNNYYPLLSYDRTNNLNSHYYFSITESSLTQLKLKSYNGLEFTLVFNSKTSLYELDIEAGVYAGYRLRFDPIKKEFYYEAPVIVDPYDIGDYSNLIEYYGYDGVHSTNIENSTIDFSSLHVISTYANFSEGLSSTQNVLNLKTNMESSFQNYHDFFVSNGYIWTADTDINFDYNSINVSGLSEAHFSGWSGLGSNLRFVDDYPNGSDMVKLNNYGFVEFTHGANTFAIAAAIAPEGSFILDDYYDPAQPWLIFNSSVDVVNVSLGVHVTDLPNVSDGYVSAAAFVTGTLGPISFYNPNAVIVESAGNNGGTPTGPAYSCLMEGGRNTADSCTDIKFVLNSNLYNNLDRTLFVGAYDDSINDLASYSVSAGSTAMNHFIVADGTSILDGGYGTSYAAPRVTGALGLVSQKFPELTAQQRKILILHTADDLGVTGVDPVFGHGLLNIGSALNPVGKLH